MDNGLQYQKILFQHEALRSRLEIREYLQHTVVQDMYENVGQSLSLVRIQLVTMETAQADIKTASDIVGKSIMDIKGIRELFYRDIELDSETGWIKIIDYTVQTLYPAYYQPVVAHGEPINFNTGLKLIVGRMAQEILIALNDQGMKFINAQVLFSGAEIKITIDFSGGPFRIKDINCRGTLDIGLKCLNFNEKVQLIKAVISRRSVEKDVNRIIAKYFVNTGIQTIFEITKCTKIDCTQKITGTTLNF